MPLTAPSVRVVVRLPFQRPENPLNDPPPVGFKLSIVDAQTNSQF